MLKRKVYIWCPESAAHGQVTYQEHKTDNFFTVPLIEPVVAVDPAKDGDSFVSMTFPKATLAICEYKAPHGTILIARQGHSPGAAEILGLWPELKPFFTFDSHEITPCLNCNKTMAYKPATCIFVCNFCGYEITEQAYEHQKILKLQGEYNKYAHEKTLQEKAAALDEAIKKTNKKKSDHSSGSSADLWISKEEAEKLLQPKTPAMQAIWDELMEKEPEPVYFSYRDAAPSEFEGVTLNPKLWESDEDAGLL